VTKRRQLVVVDGSNLATEGRATPSLRQLDEAVRAFIEEHADTEVVVVVDATFEHRIAAGERAQFKQAELAGEVVTPPAGVVGRGDAFILKIAKRADGIVLSNDSFQEFHAEHPWLFEEGRLIGGKPVPHVGWIFTPRNPVRGLKSKVATTKAARAAKAAQTSTPPDVPTTVPPPPARRARRTTKKAVRAADPEPTKAPAKRAAKAPAAKEPASKAAAPAKRTTTRRAPTAAAPAKEAAKASGTRSRSAKAAPAKASATPKGRPEPVNTSRSFLRLVTDHPLGGTVEGEVVQFTSHGAMVSVPVGRTMHVVCYAPLGGLGTPTPTRARDALKKGEVYRFRIVSFDTTRRRAELALTR
jgi:Zc3h12a-like Ribonuclease NYN domain